MMGKAVSIKEGAEAVLHGNSAQLTVLSLRPGALNTILTIQHAGGIAAPSPV